MQNTAGFGNKFTFCFSYVCKKDRFSLYTECVNIMVCPKASSQTSHDVKEDTGELTCMPQVVSLGK